MPRITYYPGDAVHRFTDNRRWSYLIKLPGVKAGLKIPVSCRLIECKQQLVTPRRVRVLASIDLTSAEVELQPATGAAVRWKVTPSVIPKASAFLTINHILNLPKEQPAIARLQGFTAHAHISQVIAMRDRLVVKGNLVIHIKYKSRL